MSESCENLVELAKAGDVRAFEALVSLHQDRVHALAYRMLGNAEDVADVIVYALSAPRRVNLDLVTMRPVAQSAQH